jgi:hypothetical protein
MVPQCYRMLLCDNSATVHTGNRETKQWNVYHKRVNCFHPQDPGSTPSTSRRTRRAHGSNPLVVALAAVDRCFIPRCQIHIHARHSALFCVHLCVVIHSQVLGHRLTACYTVVSLRSHTGKCETRCRFSLCFNFIILIAGPSRSFISHGRRWPKCSPKRQETSPPLDG